MKTVAKCYEMVLLVAFTFIKHFKGSTRIYEKITYRLINISEYPNNHEMLERPF